MQVIACDQAMTCVCSKGMIDARYISDIVYDSLFADYSVLFATIFLAIQPRFSKNLLTQSNVCFSIILWRTNVLKEGDWYGKRR
jgi:hypothetical protein